MREECRCRGCGAPILWITMRTGRHMPVETAPIRLILMRDGSRTGVLPTGEVVRGENAVGSQGVRCYAPHWARCAAYGKTKKAPVETEQTRLGV